MAGFNNATDFYPRITGQLTIYPGPINQVTATVDNNVGTPHVDVQTEYTADGMNINFDFHDMGIPGTDLTVLQPLTEQQKANARQNINAQEVLTFDSAPTQGSQNPVTSGGVYAAEQAIASDVADIEAVIPAAATSQNQLADKEYVDDSINRSSAFFRGNFETRAALMAVPWQTTDPDAANYVSNNDYAYVADDETHDDESWRYIYVLEEGGSNNGWAAQYRVNESPLTTEQLAAINSGITSAGVAQIETNRTGLASHVADTSNPHQVTKSQVGLGNVDNTSDADKPVSTAQQAALDALKDDIDSLYDPETASGDIVTIEDADPVLVDELVVDIQPVQDLHGQSAPYPAGGSKNKLGLILSNIKTINTSGTWNGKVYTYNGVSFEVLVDGANNVTGIKATGTATASAIIDLGDIIGISNGTNAILNGCPSGGSSSTYYLKFRNANILDIGSGRTFTVDGNNSLVAFVANGTTANFTFYPMVRLATETDPTFAPYSNLCPISGWTKTKINDTGINLCNPATITANARVTNTGAVESSSSYSVTDYIPVKPNTNYYILNGIGSSAFYPVIAFDKDYNVVGAIDLAGTYPVSGVITTLPNTAFIRVNIRNDYVSTFAVNYPSTVTARHDYKGKNVIVNICINQWDEEYLLGTWSLSDGTFVSHNDRLCSKNKIAVKPNTKYYFKTRSGLLSGNVIFYAQDETFISSVSNVGNQTFTTPSDCYFINISIGSAYGAVYNYDVSINDPADLTDYYPHTGNDIVYGGTLAYIGSGKYSLQVTKGYADLGKLTYVYTSGAFYTSDLANVIEKPASSAVLGDYLCSELAQKTGDAQWSAYRYNVAQNYNLWIQTDSSTTDPTTFKNSLSGIQFVYALATLPDPIILDAEDIELLEGTNNIFADAGPVTVKFAKGALAIALSKLTARINALEAQA